MEILEKAKADKNFSKELDRIKGYMTDMGNSSEVVREFLEANKSKLENRPPLDIYKNKI